MKKIMLLFIVGFILFFNSNVYAICDTADINRLKDIAKNVELSYEHIVYGNKDEGDGMMMSVYDISVSGLTDEIYILDDNGNSYYSYSAVDGIVNMITSAGERKIYIYSRNCLNVLLDTRTLSLPFFNFKSMSDECKKDEFKELDICAEFLEEEVDIGQNDEEFEQLKDEVEKKEQTVINKIRNFLYDNLIYVIGSIVVIVGIIIILVLRYRGRNVLE